MQGNDLLTDSSTFKKAITYQSIKVCNGWALIILMKRVIEGLKFWLYSIVICAIGILFTSTTGLTKSGRTNVIRIDAEWHKMVAHPWKSIWAFLLTTLIVAFILMLCDLRKFKFIILGQIDNKTKDDNPSAGI